MAGVNELDANVTFGDQLRTNEGPVVLINVLTVDPAEADQLVATWAHVIEFMKQQPGYISSQLHRGIGGSSTFLNYAVWESVEAFRNAFASPEFHSRNASYPPSIVVAPHLFKKMAVPGVCVGS